MRRPLPNAWLMPLAVVNQSGSIQWANEAFHGLAGMTPAARQPHRLHSWLGHEPTEQLLRCLATGRPAEPQTAHTFLFDSLQGASFWVQISVGIIQDEKTGEPQAVLSFSDITTLADHAHELSVFFQESISPKCFSDERGRVLRANPAFYKLLHVTEGQIMGRTIRSLVQQLPPEARTLFIDQYRTFLKQDFHQKAFYELPIRSGEHVLVEVIRKRIDVHGKTFFAVFLTDVTAREAHIKKIQESEMLLRAIFNNSQQSVVILDSEHRITYFNKKAELTIQRIFKKNIALLDDILRYAAPGTEQGFIIDFDRCMKGEIVEKQMEISYPSSDYSRWYKVTFTPIYNNKGNQYGVMFCSEDISEQKVSELRILEQNKKLFDIAQINSHDIRRPIASILGLVNLANLQNPTDPINRVVLENMERAALELDDVLKNIVLKTYE